MKAKDETTHKTVSLMWRYKRVAEKAITFSRVAENERVRKYIPDVLVPKHFIPSPQQDAMWLNFQ